LPAILHGACHVSKYVAAGLSAVFYGDADINESISISRRVPWHAKTKATKIGTLNVVEYFNP